jgi:hypothetical protein
MTAAPRQAGHILLRWRRSRHGIGPGLQYVQWDTLPTRCEGRSTAGSLGKLVETAELRGQIARFLHKLKNDGPRQEAGAG